MRDRAPAADDLSRIRFTPAILPPYMRRSKSIETLLPLPYLKGISTGDFSEALAALLGKYAPGLSPSVIARLEDGWVDEYDPWQKRKRSDHRRRNSASGRQPAKSGRLAKLPKSQQPKAKCAYTGFAR
jgi:hypothetical protein